MDIGNVYGQIDHTQTVFSGSNYVQFVVIPLVLIICIGLGLYGYYHSRSLSYRITYLMCIVGFGIYGYHIFTGTYEDEYREKVEEEEFYTEGDEIELFSDLESDVINVIKVDDTYYYINTSNDTFSKLDTNFFENRMMKMKES